MKTVNLIISGTSFWNPGDDFVRDGVIAVLRQVFADRSLNLLFYNFNADFFPQTKFSGISNMLSRGDLDRMRDHVDAVIIAGLSAGDEVKDLYRWIMDADLQKRVVMIGAGYENSYVEKHCRLEPEATVFRQARLIIGRTGRHPESLRHGGAPYVHLNCPSVLSVERVKDAPEGSRINRIGFSIQLPHGRGVINHSCDESMTRLATEAMDELAGRFEVMVLAHHKSEYAHFLDLLRGRDIPVVFSSFYLDLCRAYRQCDLVVTTRLHAGLFANAHGIPAIIINDTDRHTHALQGFPYATWVKTRAGFDAAFDRLQRADLAAIAREIANFKTALMDRYVDTLREPLKALVAGKEDAPSSADRRSRVARACEEAAGARVVKHRVLQMIGALTSDHWLEKNMEELRRECSGDRDTRSFDAACFLNFWAHAMQPRTYLEVGVRRGRSMAQVLAQSPRTQAYGFDLWVEDYGSLPKQGILTDNPGPQFVRAELGAMGLPPPAALIQGDSHQTLPAFFADSRNPQQFDLIFIDGDHSAAGALQDLEIAFGRVTPGGAVIFDDIAHPSHPELRGVWESIKSQHPDWQFIENAYRCGTGVAIRPPFDSLVARLDRVSEEARRIALREYSFDSERAEQRLARKLIRPGMTVFDVGAHEGKYTRLLSLLVGPYGRVFAFEPCASTMRRLARRVADEAMDNVILVRAAVTDTSGRARLHEFPEEYSSWNSLGRPRMADPRDSSQLVPITSRSEVPTVALDHFCQAHGIERIDYLKLDVEGAEVLALRGMNGLLGRRAVGHVQFEISRQMLEGIGIRARAAFDELAAHGYECHSIDDSGRPGPRIHDSDSFHENYIAMPAAAIAEGRDDCAKDLPIHFLTIVLNGMPYIEHHIHEFERLRCRWHWHIVEGVAAQHHDTAWCARLGGRISSSLHRNGLSNDGTSEFLDRIAAQFPEHVTVYRKSDGAFWDGKVEMVAAPLQNLHEECLLWQIDVDELWTADQLEAGRQLFIENPGATAAFYRCHFFVGPDLVITSRDTYGNNSEYEWLRTWRFTPGQGLHWQAHEPPRLTRPDDMGRLIDLASIQPLRHDRTESQGLVFQHFAYAIESQARFKEVYYGYIGAVDQWRALQGVLRFPTKLRDCLGWVHDEAIVNTASSQGIRPLIQLPRVNVATHVQRSARTRPAGTSSGPPRRVLIGRTDAIGDAVLFASTLPALRAHYQSARLAVLCRENLREFYEACPLIDHVIVMDRIAAEQDERARSAVVESIHEFAPDLILNPVYSRDGLSERIIRDIACPVKIAMRGDASNMTAIERERFDVEYSQLIESAGERKPELERHCDFLAGLGIQATGLEPRVWTTVEDEARVEAMWRETGLNGSFPIAVCPGSQFHTKIYRRYAEALAGLEDQKFVIMGGAEVVDLAPELAAALPNDPVNLAGRTTIRQLACALKRCLMYVGADSAGAHLACAVGTPNVVVMGGGQIGRFLPYSPLTSLACRPLECYGCNWWCRYSRAHCVTDIDPAVVGEAVRRTLVQRADRPRIYYSAGPAHNAYGEPKAAGIPDWLAAKAELIEVQPASMRIAVPAR